MSIIIVKIKCTCRYNRFVCKKYKPSVNLIIIPLEYKMFEKKILVSLGLNLTMKHLNSELIEVTK